MILNPFNLPQIPLLLVLSLLEQLLTGKTSMPAAKTYVFNGTDWMRTQ